MISKAFFSSFSEVKLKVNKGMREVVWLRQERRGGEGVGHISVKIKLTTFCMHLTLLNQVQVDVHVKFCYLFS